MRVVASLLELAISLSFVTLALPAQDQPVHNAPTVAHIFVNVDVPSRLIIKEDGIRCTVTGVLPPDCSSNSDDWLKAQGNGSVAVLLDASNMIAGLPGAKVNSAKVLRKLSREPLMAAYAMDGLKFEVLSDFQEIAGKAQKGVRLALDRPLEAGAKVFEKRPIGNPHNRVVIPLQDMRIRNLSVIESIAHHVSSLPGRKSLVWYCSEISIPNEAPPESSRIRDAWFAAFYALQIANMSVYPVNCLSDTLDLSSPQLRGSLSQSNVGAIPEAPQSPQTRDPNWATNTVASIAKATGGQYYLGDGSLEKALKAAAKDNQCALELSWPQQDRRAGLSAAAHKLEIDTDRPRTLLRYPEVRIQIGSSPETEELRITDLERCLSTPLDETSLPIEAVVENGDTHDNDFVLSLRINPATGSTLDLENTGFDILLTFQNEGRHRLADGIKKIVYARSGELNARAFETTLAFRPPSGARWTRVAVRSMKSHRVGSATLLLNR